PLLLSKAFAARLPDDMTGCIVNMLDQKVFNLNPDFLSYTVAKIGLEGGTRYHSDKRRADRGRLCARVSHGAAGTQFHCRRRCGGGAFCRQRRGADWH